MKIYFGFTVAGDRGSLDAARAMVAAMESAGHTVLTRHLVEDGASQADRSLPPAAVFERDMAWLRECDIFIAEVSGSSFGIGYEAAYALTALNKPAVLFFRQDLSGRISLLITGNTHPRCRLVPYRDLEDALDALKRELAS